VIAESSPAYADSSALVKLVVDEPETAALTRHVDGVQLAASRLALAEVPRAVKISGTGVERLREAELMLGSLLLVEVSETVLRRAGQLGSADLRTLDAIHLASAERIGAEEVITYDRRLAAAAGSLGFRVTSPS
jgi:predicted nucleic acid-binding protein